MFTLAIIGRPNVGKSSIFNRLARKKLAIVDDTPGVTRDWRQAEATLFDQEFSILDTAGLEEKFDQSIEGRMRKQTEQALSKADVILFVIDGRSGVTPLDQQFAQYLRRLKKPIILGVNKAENEKAVQNTKAEAYGLGFGEPILLSAAHGNGFEDLYHALDPFYPIEDEDEDFSQDDDRQRDDNHDGLDDIEGMEDFEFQDDNAPALQKPIKIAIVGRPNVGKSTLLNAIIEDERVMTGPEAGITRDSIAVDWDYNGQAFRLVDTAGMRRRSKVVNAIEKMSVEDSLRAIRLAQVVVLVLDGNAVFDKQDLQIARHIIDEGRALVIAINKWDIIKNKHDVLDHMKYKLETSLGQVRDVRFAPISALKGKNIERLMDNIQMTYALWNVRVSTGKLNRWLGGMESRNPAPLIDGRPNRLKYMAQIKNRPPTFALWVSSPKGLPSAYRRYLINGLRRDFDIPAVPIRLLVRTSKNPYS